MLSTVTMTGKILDAPLVAVTVTGKILDVPLVAVTMTGNILNVPLVAVTMTGKILDVPLVESMFPTLTRKPVRVTRRFRALLFDHVTSLQS